MIPRVSSASFRFVAPIGALALLLACACSTPHVDLGAWRAAQATARPVVERPELESDLREIDRLRASGELAASRALAVALVQERPDDGRALYRASRAESDEMVLASAGDKQARNHAAASALDYAERAIAAAETTAAARAQLAWALGSATHLLPMGDRSTRAASTIRAAEEALAIDPSEPTALATLAVVHLRLETLPWIAKLMASDLPPSSLDEAESHARRAFDSRPSRENRSILAKVLIARGRDAEARGVLEAALAEPPRFPRDAELEGVLRALLEDVD